MPSVKRLVLTYDELNEYGTFSEGDTITGKVTLELEKETKIESLFVKLKGDVRVNWSERHGDKSRTYSAHTRLFKQKQLLISQESNDTKRPAGIHMFKFSLSIPQGNMPSSFRGTYGKVVYKLEAKLSRSWRMDSTDEKELCFRSKAFPNIDQINFPQVGSTNKEVGVFSKGTVQMDVTVDKRGYVPGDSVLITARVNNSSSKDATPKFSFIQDVLYRASGNTKHEKNVIHKEILECVKPQTSKELRFSLTIPSKTPLSIQNCDILSVEYRIKTYLDISFSFDPEVVFPVDLFWISPHSAGGAVGGPSASDFPAPVSFASPYSPAAGASLYPATSQYPHSPAVYSGAPRTYPGSYHNPVPRQPDAYRSPFSSSSSASVLHPPPPLAPPPPPGPAHSQFAIVPPTYNTLEPPPPSYPLAPLSSGVTVPSAPVMTENFLSQTDEEPPSYEILFPSSNGSNSHPK
ncbi:arrestin domain-containing protein 3-like [Periophthalmus magnuspinnatus]|uniref:arrestin domain-containing protein 3-like n=1 Tax=Periophthalmus magnuspinnatus TaxID=409849 RepID=UPI00145BAFE7|nr:arrestin domain-containing protein 3-like [Periophthalmus magnuspinnatus]